MRRWKCCPCCTTQNKADRVEHGGFIEKDGHEGPCVEHQGYVRGAW